MYKYILILLLTFSQTMHIHAQDEYNSALKMVNKVKSNKNYLSATGTSTESFEKAYEQAKILLGAEIEQWLSNEKVGDISGYAAKSNSTFSKITMKRGNIYRSFVFARKKDILPVYKEEDLLLVGIGVPAEEDSPASSQDSQIASQAATQTSEALQATVETVEAPLSDSKPEHAQFVLTPIEKEMLLINKFEEIQYFIKDKKIKNYGKYVTMPKEGYFHIFIYNRDGNVPACLRYENGKQTNVFTGIEDDITLYKGCGAIWVEI